MATVLVPAKLADLMTKPTAARAVIKATAVPKVIGVYLPDRPRALLAMTPEIQTNDLVVAARDAIIDKLAKHHGNSPILRTWLQQRARVGRPSARDRHITRNYEQTPVLLTVEQRKRLADLIDAADLAGDGRDAELRGILTTY